MIIAISATENTEQAKVDPRFGRAPWFALANTDSGEIEFIENTQVLDAPQGAGIQSAQNVLNRGARVVLTGNCGPKAFRVLTAAGAKVAIGVAGTIREAIDTHGAGKLQYTDDANVEGHWV